MSPNKPPERLFKYPPMERQDLTQSQLNSFKFTPVDSTPHTTIGRNFLEEQLNQSVTRMAAKHSRRSTNTTNTLINALPENPFVITINPLQQPKTSSTDSNFFNKVIKPALAESRLRLGPAALRSAVEGAASPTRQDGFTVDRQEVDAALNLHRPSQSLNAQDLAFSPFQMPDMDPTAAAFVPGAGSGLLSPAHTSKGPGDSDTFNQALCLALANEQRAHKVNKLALNQQAQRCLELEEQLKRNATQISSLTTTVNNLGAIIKHNATKDHAESPIGVQKTDPVEDAEEVALREFYRARQNLRKSGEETSILYDALERQKEQYEAKDLSAKTDDAAAAEAVGTASTALAADTAIAARWANAEEGIKAVDDAQLFNLDLLKNPDFDDSPASALRRTLRKHFFVDDDKSPTTPVTHRKQSDRLIDISPESVQGGNCKEDRMGVGLSLAMSKQIHDEAREKMKAIGPETKPGLLTTAKPILELPAAFIAKYGSKPAQNEQVLKDQSNDAKTKMDMPNIAGIRVEEEIMNSGESTTNGLGSVLSYGNKEADQSPTAVASSEDAQSAGITQPRTLMTVQIGNNLYGEPKWNITKDNPVFDSEEEKRQAIGENGMVWLRNSPFPAHPVRYFPETAAGTTDAYRTIMIDNIPVGSTIHDILATVHGGSLESIQLYPPIGKVTSFMTARIVFNYENAAHGMIAFQEAKQNQGKDENRFKINGVAVRTWMPTDPTYPRNAELEDEVFGDSRASRIILIGEVDEFVYHEIPIKLARLHAARAVIEYSWTHDGYASIEFTSIKTAIRVMRDFKRDEDFGLCHFQYDIDYTCAPYVKGQPFGL